MRPQPMYLLFLKAAPKWAIALGVLVVSTGLFVVWLLLRQSPVIAAPQAPQVAAANPAQEERAKKAAMLPEKLGWLALVGSDLYDIGTGELLFPNWLGGIPQRLFYQKETNRLMAQTERGVIRFALDGSKDGMLGDPSSPPAFTHDGKQAMFVRNGDVWVAHVDWKGFRFVNERQATKLGQFNGQFFAPNVLMGTEKAILVRLQSQLLRVDLLTGNVEQQRIPLNDLAKRRSPNGRYLIGDDGKSIYLYDVETNTAKSFPKGRERVNDWQWLSNDACGMILGGKAIAIYDGKQAEIRHVAPLPFACNQLVAPSPDGTYAICYGGSGVQIVDFKAGATIPFGAPAQDVNWVDEQTLILSRDVPNMSLRGTWLKTPGDKEHRIMDMPYSTHSKDISTFAVIPDANVMLVSTPHSLYRMHTDGSEVREIAKLSTSFFQIKIIEPVN